jgi:hypothetical protein
MDQLIGAYKEYIVIERNELDKIEKLAIRKLEDNELKGLSEAYIEAKSVLDLIKEIKRLNIYNNDFEIKN